MKFEEALKAMLEGERAKRACYGTPIAYSQKRHKFCFWCDDDVSGKDGTHYGCEVEFSQSDRVADDWAVISDIPSNEAGLFDEKVKETLNKIGDDLYKKILGKGPYNNVDISELEEAKTYDRIEITFKSGDAITYEAGEWDDYSFNGKAVAVKKNGAWIGIYNFDHVFCVELK